MLVLYTKPYGAGSRQASMGSGAGGARLIVVVHLIPFVQPLLPGLELGKKEESPGKGAGGQAQEGRPPAQCVLGGVGLAHREILTSAQYLTANQHTANGVAKPPEGPGQAAWPIFQANQLRGERWVGAWCRWDQGWWDASSARRRRFLAASQGPSPG